jgi:hypothetical protein
MLAEEGGSTSPYIKEMGLSDSSLTTSSGRRKFLASKIFLTWT